MGIQLVSKLVQLNLIDTDDDRVTRAVWDVARSLDSLVEALGRPGEISEVMDGSTVEGDPPPSRYFRIILYENGRIAIWGVNREASPLGCS